MSLRGIVFSTALLCLLLCASADDSYAGTKCRLDFTLSSWSAFYKTAHGSGTIHCDNGQSARVHISSKGGGVTFGKSTVSGHGEFSEVASLSELYGAYAKAEAHAGAGESTDAQVVTKGEVSLALSAKGKGIDLGFAFGNFRISHPKSRH